MPLALSPLRALVVDDEPPALGELSWLLGADDRVGQVYLAGSALDALKTLENEQVDVVFCDVAMPGMDGLDLGRILARFQKRPHLVFVTAYEQHALDAFDLQAVDYVLKPVRPDRLAEAVRRVVEASRVVDGAASVPTHDETIAVELGGVTRFVRRSEVRYAEAQGDYARLHTAEGSHLVRIPLTTLETRWLDAGFIRIHRSTLVALAHIDEVHHDDGRWTVRLGGRILPVSRRHTAGLRERLVDLTDVPGHR